MPLYFSERQRPTPTLRECHHRRHSTAAPAGRVAAATCASLSATSVTETVTFPQVRKSWSWHAAVSGCLRRNLEGRGSAAGDSGSYWKNGHGGI